MPAPREARLRQGVLALSALLLSQGLEAHAFDSVTAACRQRPEQCVRVAGEEALASTVKGGAEVVSMAAASLRVLTPDTKAAIEQALVECAQWASTEVNRLHFGGRTPTREQCQEVLLETDPCGQKVTRAMKLGNEKHERALQCARERLGALIPGQFSLEQRYRYDKRTGAKQLVSAAEARTLFQKGCGDELVGTLVPDVVIHTGNPLDALAIYDFKFPCPITNEPRWSPYPEGHPYWRSHQGAMYEEAFGVTPYRVAPAWKLQ